ncbi:MAG TPA: hypothetical protein VIC06_01295 [Solirubrobacteraceae bacterium]|jgi:hypothetical protein
MTEREQRLLRHSKRERRAVVILADANERLRDDLLRKEKELYELIDANANLQVERDATDVLLGAAMDDLLANNSRPKGRL